MVPMKFKIEELRPLAILEGLPEQTLTWLADHGTRIELATGDRMFTLGQPASFMVIVVAGTIQRYEEVGGQWLVVATKSRGRRSNKESRPSDRHASLLANDTLPGTRCGD
jgi:hypothetical protein